MAIKMTAEALRNEIRSAEEFRDRHVRDQDRIIRRYTGRYYRHDQSPDRAVAENHAYEYLSVVLPTVVYDNPRCKISSANPAATDQTGTVTAGERAKGIELALNRWATDSGIYSTLFDLAVDFLFTWGVALVTTADQPGYNGAEMVPVQPYILHLENHHFFIDPMARTTDPMQNNGPRYMGHMWKADREDLIDDPAYDKQAIMQLTLDNDIDKFDEQRSKGHDIPSREEIVGWDIWSPEHQLSDAPEMNGTIFTVAAGATPQGLTKKSAMIRKPRPAYCPPWGPYVVFGCYKVPGQPYPLSPLVATAEMSEELNAHTVAAAEDAKRHKSFAVGKAGNESDAQRVQTVRNGEMILLDDPASVADHELGGVTDAQYRYIEASRQRLNRVSGLSDSMRGATAGGGGQTATGEAIAAAGGNIRLDGIKRRYREPVAKIFKAAAWYAHYGHDFQMALGADDIEQFGISQFRGGVYPGMENFRFFDLSISVDPLSIEHTNQAMFQKRVETAMASLERMAPMMPQTPWIKWREPLRVLFESLNIGEADDWLDWTVLQQAQSAIMGAAVGPGAAGAAGPAAAGPGTAPGMPPQNIKTPSGAAGGGTPGGFPTGPGGMMGEMSTMREAAAEQAAALG